MPRIKLKAFNLVNEYFKFINEHIKQRKGKGISQSDLKYGQESIKKSNKGKHS